MSLALNTKHLSSFINEEEYKAIYPQVEAAHKTLEAKNGPGSDFLGWMYLPRDYDKEEFERIKAAAAKIREDSDCFCLAFLAFSRLVCVDAMSASLLEISPSSVWIETITFTRLASRVEISPSICDFCEESSSNLE